MNEGDRYHEVANLIHDFTRHIRHNTSLGHFIPDGVVNQYARQRASLETATAKRDQAAREIYKDREKMESLARDVLNLSESIRYEHTLSRALLHAYSEIDRLHKERDANGRAGEG